MPAGTTLFDCEQQSECSFSFRKHNKSQAPLLPKRACSACSVPTACALLLSPTPCHAFSYSCRCRPTPRPWPPTCASSTPDKPSPDDSRPLFSLSASPCPILLSSSVRDASWRLPALDLLERMSQSSVLIGLVSIAVGTVLGFIWVDRLTGPYGYYDPKYAVTLLVLLLYAVYLQLSRTSNWRGARASRLNIFNFVVVILSFTVVNLYLSHSHRYF